MISKYPIISNNNKKYKVKFKDYSDSCLKLILYKRIIFIDIPLMHTFVNKTLNFVGTDFNLETRKIVEMFEYKNGIGEKLPISIVKFNKWDGDLRK